MQKLRSKLSLLAGTGILFLLFSVSADLFVAPPVRHAWSANTGFQNWEANGQGFAMTTQFARGWAWDPNIGWISFGDGTPNNGTAYSNSSATDYGVNVLTGVIPGHFKLTGYAWSPNAGWLNFEVQAQAGSTNQPRVSSSTFLMAGSVWSANLGWISLQNISLQLCPGPTPCNSVEGWEWYQ